jgi:ABC-2 type transport system ATP-binding protein
MIKADELACANAGLPAVTLHVGSGECVGLIGARRSGRTVLLRLLATLVRPSSGRLLIDGVDALMDVERARARIGYAGRDRVLCGDLTVDEHLRCHAGMRRLDERQVREAIARAELDPAATIHELSSDLQQRLSLLTALLPAPAVLLLDDPWRNLEPGVRPRFQDWLRQTRENGAAVVAALDEVDPTFCTAVAQVEGGRVRLLTPPSIEAGETWEPAPA